MRAFWFLVLRHLKAFFKDRMTFFFALMVPAMSIIIYYIMLRQMELGIVEGQINQIIKDKTNPNLPTLFSKTAGLIDCWMLSGVIGLSCITVSINTCHISVRDKENGSERDFISSPIKPIAVSLSYFAFNFILTFLVNFLLMFFTFIIVCSMGALKLTFLLFVQLVGALLVSIFSSSLFTLLLLSLMKKGTNFNYIVSILSAGLGFFIGGFMPTNMLGKAAYVSGFIPGTYSVGLFRYLYISSQQDELLQFVTEKFSKEDAQALLDKINENFSYNVKFINYDVEPKYFWFILLGSGVLFFLIICLIKMIQGRKTR